MNQRRVVGILQELAQAEARVSALHAELADAFAAEEPKKKRQTKTALPKTEVSDEAKDAARRALRRAGVVAA